MICALVYPNSYNRLKLSVSYITKLLDFSSLGVFALWTRHAGTAVTLLLRITYHLFYLCGSFAATQENRRCHK